MYVRTSKVSSDF